MIRIQRSVKSKILLTLMWNVDRPTVSIEDMMGHLTNLDTIAQDNSNNRALGHSGGIATRSYLKETLTDLGYRVLDRTVYAMSFSKSVRSGSCNFRVKTIPAATFVYSASGEVVASFSRGGCRDSTWTECQQLDIRL